MGGATYFVTFRLLQGVLSDAELMLVLDHLISGDSTFYDLTTAVVMPDHAHLILKPTNGYTLSRVMKGVKGVSARKINEMRGKSGQLWQDESFDRIIRDEDELIEKARYILENPQRAGLVDHPEEYPFYYTVI